MYSWIRLNVACLFGVCFSFIVLCYQAVMFSHYADAVEFILNRSLAFYISCQCESEAGRPFVGLCDLDSNGVNRWEDAM